LLSLQQTQLLLTGCAPHHTTVAHVLSVYYVKSLMYKYTHAIMQYAAKAATGLQPIAACPHASSLKILHWCHLVADSKPKSRIILLSLVLTYNQHVKYRYATYSEVALYQNW